MFCLLESLSILDLSLCTLDYLCSLVLLFFFLLILVFLFMQILLICMVIIGNM